MCQQWKETHADEDAVLLAEYLGENMQRLDIFDQGQLASVIRVIRESKSLSAAGRRLFAVSRVEKKSRNDADQLRKYLEKFGLDWAQMVRWKRQPVSKDTHSLCDPLVIV